MIENQEAVEVAHAIVINHTTAHHQAEDDLVQEIVHQEEIENVIVHQDEDHPLLEIVHQEETAQEEIVHLMVIMVLQQRVVIGRQIVLEIGQEIEMIVRQVQEETVTVHVLRIDYLVPEIVVITVLVVVQMVIVALEIGPLLTKEDLHQRTCRLHVNESK